jgi:nicotinamidase-related amidase
MTTRPYEPLTSENAAVILVDHQVGLMTGVRDYSTGELKHNVVALAKAAKVLNLPIIVTTTARDSMWGPTFPELLEALPSVPIIDRSSVNAFDDPKVAQAITATGRKKLIFASISWKSAPRCPPSRPLARPSTPMWSSTPPELSARPNDRSVFCACCRPA